MVGSFFRCLWFSAGKYAFWYVIIMAQIKFEQKCRRLRFGPVAWRSSHMICARYSAPSLSIESSKMFISFYTSSNFGSASVRFPIATKKNNRNAKLQKICLEIGWRFLNFPLETSNSQCFVLSFSYFCFLFYPTAKTVGLSSERGRLSCIYEEHIQFIKVIYNRNGPLATVEFYIAHMNCSTVRI